MAQPGWQWLGALPQWPLGVGLMRSKAGLWFCLLSALVVPLHVWAQDGPPGAPPEPNRQGRPRTWASSRVGGARSAHAPSLRREPGGGLGAAGRRLQGRGSGQGGLTWCGGHDCHCCVAKQVSFRRDSEPRLQGTWPRATQVPGSGDPMQGPRRPEASQELQGLCLLVGPGPDRGPRQGSQRPVPRSCPWSRAVT